MAARYCIVCRTCPHSPWQLLDVTDEGGRNRFLHARLDNQLVPDRSDIASVSSVLVNVFDSWISQPRCAELLGARPPSRCAQCVVTDPPALLRMVEVTARCRLTVHDVLANLEIVAN